MRVRTAAVVLAIAGMGACAHPVPPAASPVRSPQARLADADAQLAAGCLDCLLEAYREYAALAADTSVHAAALRGASRAALLIALRQNEVGLLDDGFLTLAQQNAEGGGGDQLEFVRIAATLVAMAPASRSPISDREIGATREFSVQQDAWTATLRDRASADAVGAYLWLAVLCNRRGAAVPLNERRNVLGAQADVPLVLTKDLTACQPLSADPFRQALAREPRAHELHYYLALSALGGMSQRRGIMDVDEAAVELTAGYDWQPRWPTLTLVRGNVAVTAEDFETALRFYDETLTLRPDDADAMVGGIRAMTYLGRHTDAIARADRLLAFGRNPGDARYWRAFNEHALKQYDEARADIDLAATLLVNPDVPKLAGLIAIGMNRVAEARTQLELALSRRRTDCETGYYLQAVLATQRDWEATARVGGETGTCVDGEEQRLTAEIESLRLSDIDASRRARQIASRERSLEANRRMRAAAWFNAAVANFNLSRPEPARAFAMRLVDDQEFSTRARAILDRLATR